MAKGRAADQKTNSDFLTGVVRGGPATHSLRFWHVASSTSPYLSGNSRNVRLSRASHQGTCKAKCNRWDSLLTPVGPFTDVCQYSPFNLAVKSHPHPHSDCTKSQQTADWLANTLPEISRMVFSSVSQILGLWLPASHASTPSFCPPAANARLTPCLQVTQHLAAVFFGLQVQTSLERASPGICLPGE